jgi:UrcA family protein
MSGKAICALALSALALAGAAAPAVGQNRTVVVTGSDNDAVVRLVSYRDLDLASAPGERALIKRVHYTVGDVCRKAVGDDKGYLLAPSMTCRSQSWAGAEPQVARAVQRAREIAANGWSAIAPVAISISAQ